MIDHHSGPGEIVVSKIDKILLSWGSHSSRGESQYTYNQINLQSKYIIKYIRRLLTENLYIMAIFVMNENSAG